jgi:hypothetical protein
VMPSGTVEKVASEAQVDVRPHGRRPLSVNFREVASRALPFPLAGCPTSPRRPRISKSDTHVLRSSKWRPRPGGRSTRGRRPSPNPGVTPRTLTFPRPQRAAERRRSCAINRDRSPGQRPLPLLAVGVVEQASSPGSKNVRGRRLRSPAKAASQLASQRGVRRAQPSPQVCASNPHKPSLHRWARAE